MHTKQSMFRLAGRKDSSYSLDGKEEESHDFSLLADDKDELKLTQLHYMQ